MIQRGDGPRLAFKSFGKTFFGYLDCDDTIEPLVARLVHLRHAACADRHDDFIWSELCSRCERHQCSDLLRTIGEFAWHCNAKGKPTVGDGSCLLDSNSNVDA